MTMPVEIKSVTDAPPVSHFVKSRDYEAVRTRVIERGKKVVLIYGKSGQGKTQIGNYLMRETTNDGVTEESYFKYVFFFQSYEQDTYNVSFSNILAVNNWLQDDQHKSNDFDFVKLCENIEKEKNDDEKVLFHFDDLKTSDTDWVKKLYEMVRQFLMREPLKNIQLLITVPEQPDDAMLSERPNAHIHKMSGFDSDDIKRFFDTSIRHTAPTFLNDRVDEIADVLGNSPQLYKAKLERFQRMARERDLEDFLYQLKTQTNKNVNKHTEAIKQRLRHLHYLEIWKVMTNFNKMNIPSDVFYAILIYCCETKELGLSRGDDHAEIFSVMLSEYLRSEFVTEHREGRTNQEVHWTIHTEVYNCLKELVSEETDEGKNRYLIVGLMAMASIVDRDDRFHSDKREYTSRHVNMLSQAQTLYHHIEEFQTSNPNLLSDYQQLAKYQLLTGIYYAKLKKVGSDVNVGDLKHFYKLIMNLEDLLSRTNENLPNTAAGEEPMLVSENAVQSETSTRYLSMLGFLQDGSNEECNVALRLYRFSERDEKTFQKYLEEQHVVLEESFRPNAQHYGMFTKGQLQSLQRAQFVLNIDSYRQVFPLEILASMYIILGMLRDRVRNIGDHPDLDEFWTKTSYDIFRFVTLDIFKVIQETTRKEFMQRVIIERDRVLQSDEVNNQLSFVELSESYKCLKELKEVFEHGFLRSILKEDLYHLLNCDEGLLQSVGNIISSSDLNRDQIATYVDEGLKLCQDIKSRIVKLYESSRNELDAWRQYAYGMEYQANFMFRCGQSSLYYRYYAYALYSFYKYTDRNFKKCRSEKKFHNMCRRINELATATPPTFTDTITQIISDMMQPVHGRCVCLFKREGCVCMNENLGTKFLQHLEAEEGMELVIQAAIETLISKLCPRDEPVPPV